MKRFSIIIFHLLSVVAFAQQNKIEGLGPFKIGKTLCSKIPEVGDTSKGRLYYCKADNEFTECWCAWNYPIADFWIEGLSLTFYNDTLYSIECRNSIDLDNAFELKFGPPLPKTYSQNVVCRNGLGITFTKKEGVDYSYYPTKSKNIEAYSYARSMIDYKCEETFASGFVIINKSIELKVNRIVEKAADKKAEREKAEKLKKLEGL